MIGSFFNFKERPSAALRSGVVYRFTCGYCNVTYIGQTMRHFKVRVSEHIGISALTGKKCKHKLSAVNEHLLSCPYDATFKDFEILSSTGNEFILELKESLHIHKENPALNKHFKSVPLYLFQ